MPLRYETVIATGTGLLKADTFVDLLRQRVQATPHATMWLDANDARLTFVQFNQAVESLASNLYARGIGPGTVVAWQLPTRISTAVLMLALARLGAIQNPIIHLYREREVAAVIRQSRPQFFFVPAHVDPKARDYVAMAKAVTAESPTPPEIIPVDDALLASNSSGVALPLAPISGDEVRWMLYTSGTTAEPKGARHTDISIMTAAHFLAQQIGAGPNDVGTIAFPVAHIGGAMYIAMMLASGMAALMLESFDPAVAVSTMHRAGVTLSGGSTVHYQAFLAQQRKQPGEPIIPTLRLLSGGGAPKPAQIYYDAKKELNCIVTHAYGMTEVPLIAQGSMRDSDEQLANSDGSILPGAELRLVRSDGTLAQVGEEGEVRIRGPQVCKGYTDAEATAKAFDADGFFCTGDLAIQRADGHIKLTGRLKDIIIRKGENISAQEIEQLLSQHPKVAACAVIGLPDAERGERVCAVVELRPDVAPLTFAEMKDYFQQAALMRQKIPEQLEIVERLPRSETFNKVLKHQLRARFAHP